MQLILLDAGRLALWAATTSMEPVTVAPESILDSIVRNFDIEQGRELSSGDVPRFSFQLDELDVLGVRHMTSQGVTSLMEQCDKIASGLERAGIYRRVSWRPAKRVTFSKN